jgi:hypothetical protein
VSALAEVGGDAGGAHARGQFGRGWRPVAGLGGGGRWRCQHEHGRRRGRGPSRPQMALPGDHVRLSGSFCFLQCEFFFDLIDFAIYFQQKQILTLNILSFSWFSKI